VNTEPRLARLLTEVSAFADEIVVGVDASSTDRSFAIATAHADVVYRFQHRPHLAPARLLPLRYASGDWILSIDDDESIEPSTEALLPELMADPTPTHYWFPRRWVTSLEPAEYVHAAPWFPDWQLRLFRNDRRLVWKPPRPHTGYQVIGPGYFESRVSLLHFEPLLCDAATRRAKVDRYRRAGGAESGQAFFDAIPAGSGRAVTIRPAPLPAAAARRGIAYPDVHDEPVASLPPWGSAITEVRMAAACRPGALLLAEVAATNTGELAWTPPVARWPILQLGAHLLSSDGTLVEWDAARTAMPRFVAPGESVRLIGQFEAPQFPGAYLVEWDLVSEGECWFAACGGRVQQVRLDVTT